MFGIGLLAGGCMIPPGVLFPMAPELAHPAAVSEPLDGADRDGVAIAISSRLASRGPVPVVYLVADGAYADAVAAGPAAARDGGAILYTAGGSLPGATADALVRLGPARVEVVGSGSTIGSSVVAAVTASLGSSTVVERISGATSYALAAALSARAFTTGRVDTVVVASADSYWEAVAAGPAAARWARPCFS